MGKKDSLYQHLEGVDRREKPRFNICANCTFQPFTPKRFYDEYTIYKIDNIGLGGLSFLSDQTFDINTRFFFVIAIQECHQEEPINAVGDVLWVVPAQLPLYKYKVGVRFVRMLEDDLMNLTHHFYAGYNLSTFI